MAIRVYKPTSPARRHMSVLTFEEVTKKAPEKSLTEVLKKNSGRNKQGKITVRQHPRQGQRDRIRSQPQRLHRPAVLRGRREALHPGSSGTEGRRHRDLQ